jgi:uncharacterized protein (TIGR02996 family)
MRTFEFDDGKSRKFWNIDLQGQRFTVTYGRLGTQGQTQTKEFANAAKAQAEHDKLIKEKLAKGYVETTAGGARAPTAKALENALAADPDDLAAHAAYADFLTEQGDPRGEFIQVQLALEDPARPAKERKELQKREAAFLKKLGSAWLGPLAERRDDPDEDSFEFQYARGWIDSLQVSRLTVPLARALARSHELRLLRRLIIETDANEDDDEFEPGPDIPSTSTATRDYGSPDFYPLRRASCLANLRVFQVGIRDDSQSQARGDAVVELVKKMSRLEELYLLALGIDTKTLFGLKNLTHLRILQLYHQDNYPLEVLARNPALGQLTHLLLIPHMLEPGESEAYISQAEVRALVRSPHLRRLTHLHLRLWDLGDRGCQDIVDSGILNHLKVLDLHGGCITDVGAQTLAGCADLRNLELLDVSSNMLTAAGVRALKAVGIKVQATGNDGASDTPAYFYEGDME